MHHLFRPNRMNIALVAVFFFISTIFALTTGNNDLTPSTHEVGSSQPGEVVSVNQKLDSGVDSLMAAAVRSHAFPAAAVAIGHRGTILKMRGYGHFTYESNLPITPTTIFDIASLTKVVATTTAAMLLYEQGRLDLDTPIVHFLPEFAENGKSRITVRHLLTHTSGLPAYRPYHTMDLTTREQILDAILNEKLSFRPGTRRRYSDLGMITLALVIEKITEQNFADYTRTHIFEPLQMWNTGFRPVGILNDSLIVPTEFDRVFRKKLIQGEVHDEIAYLLGGTAGNAGLFSTVEDLSKFALMLTNNGTFGQKQFLHPETIRLFTTQIAVPGDHPQALGWAIKSQNGESSAGKFFGPMSFGHTGFTGTSIWIDPDQSLFVVLLTNRVYPSRNNDKHVQFRAELADLAYTSVCQEVLSQDHIH